MDSLPLYPFGYGLSYTTFDYEKLTVIPDVIEGCCDIIVSVDVINSGEREGDEVVQLYVKDIVSSVVTSDRLLKGFKRIHLKPGERKNVSFCLKYGDLSLIDRNMNRVVEPGTFEILVGGNSESGLKTGIEVLK